jgi:hypothetical protein
MEMVFHLYDLHIIKGLPGTPLANRPPGNAELPFPPVSISAEPAL